VLVRCRRATAAGMEGVWRWGQTGLRRTAVGGARERGLRCVAGEQRKGLFRALRTWLSRWHSPAQTRHEAASSGPPPISASRSADRDDSQTHRRRAEIEFPPGGPSSRPLKAGRRPGYGFFFFAVRVYEEGAGHRRQLHPCSKLPNAAPGVPPYRGWGPKWDKFQPVYFPKPSSRFVGLRERARRCVSPTRDVPQRR